MALLDRFAAIVPRWFLTAPRTAVGQLMLVPAALLDILGEGVMQARKASLPGQSRVPGIAGLGGFDSIDALFPIARDRMVVPAQVFGMPWVTEKPWQLAYRLRNWRDDWQNNTGPWGLLDQIAAVLTPTVPVLRLVQKAGGITSWFTREADGTRRLQRSDGNGFFYGGPTGVSGEDTTMAASWDWDSTSNPAPFDAGDGTRAWIIAYVPFATPYVTATDLTFDDPGVVDDAWNNPTAQVNGQPGAGTCGTNAPRGFVDLVYNVIQQRHSAGARIKYLIAAFDAASFNPDGTSTAASPSLTAYPDGTWGWHSTPGTSGGQPTRLVARLQTAEYFQEADIVAVGAPPV